MSRARLRDWREAIPLVRQIYERNGVGCCWHIVLDDQNVDDHSVEFCARQAEGQKCRNGCQSLAPIMRSASVTQRMKIANNHEVKS